MALGLSQNFVYLWREPLPKPAHEDTAGEQGLFPIFAVTLVLVIILRNWYVNKNTHLEAWGLITPGFFCLFVLLFNVAKVCRFTKFYLFYALW